MTTIRRAAALGVVFCAIASGAYAQEPARPHESALSVGSRVRLTSSLVHPRLPGVVESVEDGVLTLRTDGGGAVKMPMASIARVDVSLGRKRSVLQGLAAGALFGVLLGFAPDVDPNACVYDPNYFCSRGEALVGMTVLMGGIGTAVGTFIKRERWTRITITPSLPAGAGSAHLAVAVRF